MAGNLEFFLHNEEGISFPPVRPAYRSGELYFDRFRALIPRDADDSIIGQGGAGVIHLMRDEVMDRIVAVKLLHDDLQRDPTARMDVVRETRQAIALTHPNIVRIHDFHEDKKGWGISMQYIEGKNLDEWRFEGASPAARAIAPYPVERIEEWIRQLCEALRYVHEDARMVHRDIKPKNLMLERDGKGAEKLYLTDFGITKKLSQHTLMLSKVQPARDEEDALGTLPYMSWEQLENSSPSWSDDIYAVGATIYDLLTGRPPYYEGGIEQIKHQIEKVPPPRMAERLESLSLPNTGIPEIWEEVVRDCLAKDPADRPKSIREVAERLGLAGTSETRGSFPVADPKIEQELVQLKEELEEKEAAMETLEGGLETTQAELAALTQKLEEGSRHIAELQDELTERSERISHLDGEQEERTNRISELNGELEQRTALLTELNGDLEQKTTRIRALEQEVIQLREDLTGDDEASKNLNAKIGELEGELGRKNDEIHALTARVTELQEGGQADQLQLNTLGGELAQRNEELVTLQASFKQQNAQLLGLQRQRASEEEELQQARRELETAQADAKRARIDLTQARGEQEKALADLARVLDEQATAKTRLKELDQQLKAREGELQAATQKLGKLESSHQAALQKAEAQLAKTQHRYERTRQDLESARNQKRASLIPLVATLVIAMVLGLGGGAIFGKVFARESGLAQLESFVGTQIPSEDGKPGELISVELFQTFARENGVLEKHFEQLATNLGSKEPEAPVRGVSYNVALAFCAWLNGRYDQTEALFLIPSKQEIDDIRSSAEAPPSIPEWTSNRPESEEEGPGGSQVISGETGGIGWQYPKYGATLNDRDLGFRVILKSPSS